MGDNKGKLNVVPPAEEEDTATRHHQQQLNSSSSPKKNKKRIPVFVFFKDARNVFKLDEVGREILRIGFPAALALAADPVASLIDTAFIGRLGSTQLAAVGVAIAIFNQASKITIFPLVSITTSFVAEEETIGRSHYDNNNKVDDVCLDNLEKGTTTVSLKDGDSSAAATATATATEGVYVNNTSAKSEEDTAGGTSSKKRHIPSASTAIFIGLVLGLFQTLFLIFSAKLLLSFMGVKSGSPMLKPALKYLTLRSFGAPAVLLSLAMQGVFRGFKDTTTPLYATVAGDLTNIILDPILIFVCRMGVSGAAIAHVLSQYLISVILLWKLMKQVDLLAPNIKDLQFNKFLKNGVVLLARVIAVTFCVTLAASLAARLGETPMAAFQVCLQVWMTSSLLADGLAVAGQAILATSFAAKDYTKATAAATRVLQMGFVLGLGLAILVGVGLRFGSGVFTDDINVKHIIFMAIPFVAATQPINSVAFVFDGVNFGASDFAYSAYSMVLVCIVTVATLYSLSKSSGFVGIWVALTIYMALRALAGFWRMGTGTGPWHFLRSSSY